MRGLPTASYGVTTFYCLTVPVLTKVLLHPILTRVSVPIASSLDQLVLLLTLLRIRTPIDSARECRSLRCPLESLRFSRAARVVRSRIVDSREKCVLGAIVSHGAPISRSCDHVSSTLERNVLWVQMSCTTG